MLAVPHPAQAVVEGQPGEPVCPGPVDTCGHAFCSYCSGCPGVGRGLRLQPLLLGVVGVGGEEICGSKTCGGQTREFYGWD